MDAAAGVVRRPAGPWTAQVHDLLRSLPDGIGPRPVSLDADHEVVTCIEGQVGERPLSADVRSSEALASVAALLRRFHDAVGGAVCHNDAGPWNTVFDGRRAVGLIDWDLAGAGPAINDVALAVWHWAPLYEDSECVRIGWPSPPDRLERMRLFCDAYGVAVDARLWESVGERMRWYRACVLSAQAAPTAPGSAPWLKVDPALVERDMAFVSRWLPR